MVPDGMIERNGRFWIASFHTSWRRLGRPPTYYTRRRRRCRRGRAETTVPASHASPGKVMATHIGMERMSALASVPTKPADSLKD